MRWPVWLKLTAGFVGIVAVIVALAILDRESDAQTEDRLERLHDRGIVGTQMIGHAIALMQQIRAETFHHVAAVDDTERARIEQRVADLENELHALLLRYRSELPAGDTRIDQITTVLEMYERVSTHRRQVVFPASRAGDVTLALQELRQTNGPQMEAVLNNMAQLEQAHIAESERVYREAVDTLDDANRTSTTLSVLGVLAALAIAAAVSQHIASRLRAVSAAAGRVAGGDLTARAPVGGGDEISDVAAAFNAVTTALATKIEQEQETGRIQAEERERLAAAVRSYGEFIERVAAGELTARLAPQGDGELGALGTNLEAMGEALRTMTLRIHQAVGALSSATAEIGTTVREHATSANETASAVAETAATVDEVQQSAERVTEHARHVHEVARRSVEVSAAGRQAVEHTVDTMNDVRQQVDGIANRILSLSEQTQAVGHIITSVNELSEQSNLLALNAAIEAARAGEAGAGFAVVAREIRALADQSREATAHVRAILGDIQRSTTEAVLATEEGSKAVARGVDAVRGAGDRIEQLAGSIAEATRAAEHILTAAQQQAQGVGQISQAIHAIDAASRQTVSGTQIIESASRALSDLARDLRDAVAQYRA